MEQERRQTALGNVSTMDAHIKTLRKVGTVVDIREIPSQAVGPLVQAIEAMNPSGEHDGSNNSGVCNVAGI